MIEVFGKELCAYCSRAKALLKDEGLEFTYRDVEQDAGAFEEMMQRSDNYRTVPQVFIDGEFVGGYDELRSHLKGRP